MQIVNRVWHSSDFFGIPLNVLVVANETKTIGIAKRNVLISWKLINNCMAKNEPVLVYNTKKGGEPYRIHPDLAKDKAWMEARGLMLHEEVKPMEVTNMPAIEPAKQTAPVESKKKGATNAS